MFIRLAVPLGIEIPKFPNVVISPCISPGSPLSLSPPRRLIFMSRVLNQCSFSNLGKMRSENGQLNHDQQRTIAFLYVMLFELSNQSRDSQWCCTVCACFEGMVSKSLFLFIYLFILFTLFIYLFIFFSLEWKRKLANFLLLSLPLKLYCSSSWFHDCLSTAMKLKFTIYACWSIKTDLNQVS